MVAAGLSGAREPLVSAMDASFLFNFAFDFLSVLSTYCIGMHVLLTFCFVL